MGASWPAVVFLVILTAQPGCSRQSVEALKEPSEVASECPEDIFEITSNPVRVSSGAWQFSIRILAVRCVDGAEALSGEAAAVLIAEVVQAIEEMGLAFFHERTQVRTLEAIVAKAEQQLGQLPITRIMVVTLASAESEPAVP